MTKEEILDKLKDDQHYYGDFGKQFLSNSDIYSLLNDPLSFRCERTVSAAFLIGGYFHTCILEPDKIGKYRVIDASNRNTKIYKEESNGELTLLHHEVEKVLEMRDKILSDINCKELIKDGNVEYEVPGLAVLEDHKWKGKADILNHTKKLIVDLKTTSDISQFKISADKYNYDSQAYIYKNLFGYDVIFIAIDKKSHKICIFDCSEEFYERGKEKVALAIEQYKLIINKSN
jgi:hypothetical protein